MSKVGMSSRAGAACLAAVLSGSAMAAGPEQKLAGSWRAAAAERNGAPAADVVGHTLTFSGNTFQIAKGGQPLYGGTYALSASGRMQQIAFRQTLNPLRPGEWQGLYRLRGNSLVIIDNADDPRKPRPARFSTAPGSGYVLVRFVRQ